MMEQAPFSASMNRQFAKAPSDTLDRFRKGAKERFEAVGLPGKKSEVFRYLPLKNLYKQDFSTFETSEEVKIQPLPECAGRCLVFTDGCFRPDLSLTASLKNVIALPLSKAMGTYGAFLQTRLWQGTQKESDPFALLNTCLHKEGLFLYLPPNAICQGPIQILHIISSHEASAMACPRLHVFAGKGAEATLISTTMGQKSAASLLLNSAYDFSLEAGAYISFIQNNTFSSDSIWLFDSCRASLKRDAHFTAVSVTDGSKCIRHDYAIRLLEEGGHADLNGAWMLKGAREAHVNVLIEHLAPSCTSNQLFKGVLLDSSKSSFEGKIYVHAEAQKTDAYQLNNNLLLSRNATANTKPNLEIFADDVKASHGATVGQLDEEVLFYMKTRGMTDKCARALLIRCFLEDVLRKISIPSLRDL